MPIKTVYIMAYLFTSQTWDFNRVSIVASFASLVSILGSLFYSQIFQGLTFLTDSMYNGLKCASCCIKYGCPFLLFVINQICQISLFVLISSKLILFSTKFYVRLYISVLEICKFISGYLYVSNRSVLIFLENTATFWLDGLGVVQKKSLASYMRNFLQYRKRLKHWFSLFGQYLLLYFLCIL